MVKWSSNHCILCIIYVLSWILYKLMVIWRFLYWSMGEYVILQCVPSTVILWIEFSWWRKSYSNNATLLLGGRHRYKKMASSQSGCPLWNIHISNDNGYFTFTYIFFFPLSLQGLLTDLIIYRYPRKNYVRFVFTSNCF